METNAVEFRGLTKFYGDCYSNRGVNLSVRAGTIHAIIGENGAGKSTAMKMLYGMVKPNSGEILVHGVPRSWRSPSDAIAAGIGMVHQHFMLAGPYTVLENILLGAEPSSGVWKWLPRSFRPVQRSAARERLQGLSTQYGLKVDLDAQVESLSVGIQQRIEILKLLYRDANILILDEPTAVLTPQEITELFVQLRKLRDEGKTILIITHKLREVLELADDITAFREGQVVGHRKASETDPNDLASLMVGRKVSLTVDAPPAPALGEPVLQIRDLTLCLVENKPCLDHLGFEVRAGEVVGIAGVEGNGQSELLQILLHPEDYRHRAIGTIECLGRETLGHGKAIPTYEIKTMGVGIIPEDRHREGLLLDQPLESSFVLGMQRNAPFSSGGLLAQKEIRKQTEIAIEEYDVRPRNADLHAGRLSGGNQQKLIVGREFFRKPKFLIAAQPTRGVDVGAIEFIHSRILEARTAGTGVLVVSSELDEVMALSDRILVMYCGKIVAEFARGEADRATLGLYMGGGKR